MTELRWANLGWIYRWTTKVYDFSQRISFPEELGKVCRSVVRSALPDYHDYGKFARERSSRQNLILVSSISTS